MFVVFDATLLFVLLVNLVVHICSFLSPKLTGAPLGNINAFYNLLSSLNNKKPTKRTDYKRSRMPRRVGLTVNCRALIISTIARA